MLRKIRKTAYNLVKSVHAQFVLIYWVKKLASFIEHNLNPNLRVYYSASEKQLYISATLTARYIL